MSRKLAITIVALSITLAILLVVLFAFPLRHVFMSSVVAPIVTSFLVLRWYLHRISQFVLWVVLVVAGGVIMSLIMLRPGSPRAKLRKRKYVLITERRTTDLKRLSATIARARRHAFARRRIASELVPVSIRLIAQRERLSLSEARDRFESFDWCEDSEVAAFFDFRRRYHGAGLGKAFDKRLRQTIAFLEHYHQGV